MLYLLKALADEKRYKILEMLLHKKYCVKALSKHLNISEPAVSQHLKILKNAGLIDGKKESYFMHYQVNKLALKALGDHLISLSMLNDEKKCQRRGSHTCCMERNDS